MIRKVLLCIVTMVFVVASLAEAQVYKSEVGNEDMVWYDGTVLYSRRLSTGAYTNYTKIHAGHVPFVEDSSLNVGDLTDGSYGVTIKPLDVISRGPKVNIRSYAGGNTSGCFDSAITSIGSNNVTLLVDDTIVASANNTVPANITLEFTRDGMLEISANTTIGFNGYIVAEPTKIFSLANSSTSITSFSLNAQNLFYAEWWGAIADSSTDCTVAIQKALDAGRGPGATIQLLAGRYETTSSLFVNYSGTTIRGVGRSEALVVDDGGSLIRATGLTSMDAVIEVPDSVINVVMEKFGINSPSAGYGFFLNTNTRNISLRDVFARVNNYGLQVGTGTNSDISDIYVSNSIFNTCDVGVFIRGGSQNVVLIGVDASNNYDDGLQIDLAKNVTVVGGRYVDSGDYNIKISSSINVAIINSNLENDRSTCCATVDRAISLQDSGTGPNYNVLIKNNYMEADYDGTYVDYLISIDDSSCINCEISNNSFIHFNTAAISNGTGNSGIAENNYLYSAGNDEGDNYSLLFDNERGWVIDNSHNNANGFYQASNLQSMAVPSGTTTDLRVFSVPADSSAIATASAVWRKTNAADTNTYEISYFVERDGSGAPTVTQFRQDATEDVAANNFIYSASGNDVALQYVEAAGDPGYIYFKYMIMDIVEQGS